MLFMGVRSLYIGSIFPAESRRLILSNRRPPYQSGGRPQSLAEKTMWYNLLDSSPAALLAFLTYYLIADPYFKMI